MSERHFPQHVPLDDLKCLVVWPEGTVGHIQELTIIELLNELCKQHGYGRVPQLAAAIEDIWRHPEKIADYTAQTQAHLTELAEAQARLASGEYDEDEAPATEI